MGTFALDFIKGCFGLKQASVRLCGRLHMGGEVGDNHTLIRQFSCIIS